MTTQNTLAAINNTLITDEGWLPASVSSAFEISPRTYLVLNKIMAFPQLRYSHMPTFVSNGGTRNKQATQTYEVLSRIFKLTCVSAQLAPGPPYPRPYPCKPTYAKPQAAFTPGPVKSLLGRFSVTRSKTPQSLAKSVSEKRGDGGKMFDNRFRRIQSSHEKCSLHSHGRDQQHVSSNKHGRHEGRGFATGVGHLSL